MDRPLISILQVGKADRTGQDVRRGRIIGQGEERRREASGVERRGAQRNINGSVYPVIHQGDETWDHSHDRIKALCLLSYT